MKWVFVVLYAVIGATLYYSTMWDSALIIYTHEVETINGMP
jgi:hypothetical protein